MKPGAGRILKTCIETERLCLRAYEAGDGPMYYAAGIRNRDHLAEFESDNVLMHLKNETHAESVVRQLLADWTAGSWFFIGVFEKDTHQWCGQVYVEPADWESLQFTIGFVADVRCEGKRYVSEAVRAVLKMLFDEVNANLLRAECAEHNVRSRRLLERCGFKREGYAAKGRPNTDRSKDGGCLYVLSRKEYLGSSAN